MDINSKDLAAYVDAKLLSANNDAVAAGSGDATEVTCAEIDMDPYDSGYIEIHYVTTLTADKTLSFGVQKEDSDAAGATKSADVDVLAATVVRTGACTAGTGILQVPIDGDVLKTYKRFVAFLITPDLSADGTDTCTWSATFHGVKRSI